jgi:hypothetical protein
MEKALCAALVYVLLSANPFADSYQIHAEHYAALPYTLSIIAIWHGCHDGSIIGLFAAGIFMAITVLLYKLTFLSEGLTLAILMVMFGCATALVWFASGIILVILMIYLWCYRKDALPSFFALVTLTPAWRTLCHYRKSLQSEIAVAGGLSSLSLGRMLLYSTGSLPFLLLATAISIGGFSNQPQAYGLLLALLSASVAGIFAQGKYYQAHLYPLFPIAAILAGSGAWDALHSFGGSLSGIMAIAVPATLLVWIYVLWRDYYGVSPLAYHLRKCSIGGYPVLSYLAVEVIAAHIQSNSRCGERIVLWGYHQEIYVLSKRRAAVGPRLENSLLTDAVLSDAAFGHEWRKWLLDAVAEQKPEFIVDMDGTLNIDCLNRATGLMYTLSKTFYGLFNLYRLDHGPQQKRCQIDTDTLVLDFLSGQKGFGHCSPAGRIHRVNRLVNTNNMKIANVETDGEVNRLMRDWLELNNIRTTTP